MPGALVDDPHMPDIKRVLGPILVGTLLNALIYGICLAQFGHTSLRGWKGKGEQSMCTYF